MLLSITFQGSSPAPSSEGDLPTTGVLTSPNFPERYFNNLDQVQKIQVPEGNTIWIRFTNFDCEREWDTVTVSDKDGTRLGLFDGGENSDDDWRNEIVSNTDTVKIVFHTDNSRTGSGWRLDWGKYQVILIACIILNVLCRNGWR